MLMALAILRLIKINMFQNYGWTFLILSIAYNCLLQ